MRINEPAPPLNQTKWTFRFAWTNKGGRTECKEGVRDKSIGRAKIGRMEYYKFLMKEK